MTRPAVMPARSGSDGASVVHVVTVIMGVVVGLTFLFGFGNVLDLVLRLGVPVWSRRSSHLRSICRSLGCCWALGIWRSLARRRTYCGRLVDS
jgi:hypothetical protein